MGDRVFMVMIRIMLSALLLPSSFLTWLWLKASIEKPFAEGSREIAIAFGLISITITVFILLMIVAISVEERKRTQEAP